MIAQRKLSGVVLAITAMASLCACTPAPSRDDGQYGLMRAITQGDMRQFQALLSDPIGLDINWQSAGVGPTPLSVAAAANQLSMVKLLLSRGADPNRTGREGRAPIHEAVSLGNVAIVETLLKAGANANAVGERYGYTPIATAASDGNLQMVRLLIKYGADVQQPIRDGRTPMVLAKLGGHMDVVQELQNRIGAVPRAL